MKKIIIPSILLLVILIFAVRSCLGGGKIIITPDIVQTKTNIPDSIELKVYVENSGSMDAYMCAGSNLKDAVFDYVSDLKNYSKNCSLYYINSQIIPYSGDLDSYIKNLTPSSFSLAGGDRRNTDLRLIISNILKKQKINTVSMFVSDCILDIPESATDYFGNCQVSIKNAFKDVLHSIPNLGVEIIQLESKFEGYWYCGNNSQYLSNVKRPYYIWLIGNQNVLSYLNSKVKVDDIIGGIKNYCAYSTSQPIPFDMDKKTFVVNHSNKINPQLLVNLNGTLQNDLIITNINQYNSSNPTQSKIVSVNRINNSDSPYSHVVELEIDNPETMKTESVTFSYPYLQSWVTESNDSTGTDIEHNLNKTTGILYLIKGVAEAYKQSLDYGTVSINLNNK